MMKRKRGISHVVVIILLGISIAVPMCIVYWIRPERIFSDQEDTVETPVLMPAGDPTSFTYSAEIIIDTNGTAWLYCFNGSHHVCARMITDNWIVMP